jgi:hypothetical protein
LLTYLTGGPDWSLPIVPQETAEVRAAAAETWQSNLALLDIGILSIVGDGDQDTVADTATQIVADALRDSLWKRQLSRTEGTTAAERRDTGGGNSGHRPLRKPTAMILRVSLSRSTVAEPNLSPGLLMRELDGHQRIPPKVRPARGVRPVDDRHPSSRTHVRQGGNGAVRTQPDRAVCATRNQRPDFGATMATPTAWSR